MRPKRDTSIHVRRGAAVLALAGTFAIAYAGGAAGASSSSQIGITAVINGQKFENQAVVIVNPSTDDGRARTMVRGRSSVPKGQMGATARLYTSSGILVKMAGPTFSEKTYSANAWLIVDTPVVNTVNGTAYYSQGTSYHWNGSSFVTYTTFKSPSLTS